MTIVELMIALALGLLIVLAATGLLVASKAGYLAQDQTVRLNESGRYAMEILARAIRQAGYESRDATGLLLAGTADLSANVTGMDAMTLKKTTPALNSPLASDVVNGSDILALRFFGDGNDESGSILNCAGLAVPAPTALDASEQQRGWSIFFVAKDSAGEPELRCKYQSKNSWNADAIARGVESFQVLYGVDADADGIPERYLNASAVDELDDSLPLSGENAVARAAERNRKTHWKKIRAIRIALLVRGTQAVRDDALSGEYHLFGTAYSEGHAATDKGVLITEKNLPAASRNRMRRVFTQTIQLRNDAAGSAT